jgi:hypothetical protein
MQGRAGPSGGVLAAARHDRGNTDAEMDYKRPIDHRCRDAFAGNPIDPLSASSCHLPR